MLKGQVDDIANAGVTHVWLPPPSHSVAPQGGMSCSVFFLPCLDASASSVITAASS
jgi:hypothetical protein